MSISRNTLLGLLGAGLLAFGAATLYSTGHNDGLFGTGKRRRRGRGKLLRGVAQAPVISSHSIAGMKTQLRASPDMSIEERVATIQDLVHQSVQDPRIRKLALQITSKCPERDGKCEAEAIYQAIKKRVRYTGDIGPIKLGRNGPVEGIDLFQSAYRTWEFGGGDCLPVTTLVMKEDYSFVPLIMLNPGDRIMGDGAWTTVQERWLTGEKELLAFELSNGSVLRCTPEHRIFRVGPDGEPQEIRASEARIGDDLIAPARIPIAEIDDKHGGFGEHPIYRITPRAEGTTRGGQQHARIRAIRDGGVELCADLTTDSGRFWLPEADVLVHNCDDHSIISASLLAANGLEPQLRVTAESRSSDWGHIYTVVGLPKEGPSKFVALDTTLPGNKRFGYEVPYAKKIDFPA